MLNRAFHPRRRGHVARLTLLIVGIAGAIGLTVAPSVPSASAEGGPLDLPFTDDYLCCAVATNFLGNPVAVRCKICSQFSLCLAEAVEVKTPSGAGTGVFVFVNACIPGTTLPRT